MNLTERYNKKLGQAIEQEDISLDGVLLQMEVTNACNHRCVFCPNEDSSRKRRMIDLNLAKRVMEECAEFLGDDRKICFHMNGEPLLYKPLPELVAYSKKLGYDYAFVTTNGSVATEELLTELFEAGLDSIKFSINAGTRETYTKIHGVDDFEKVMNALKFSADYRMKMKKNIKIFVSCVGVKDNYSELEHFREMTEPYCDEVVFYYPCAYAGQKINRAHELRCDLSGLDITTFEITHKAPCAVLWNSINVTCEGYLSLCCSESDNRLIVEDINHMSVKDAWLGEKMMEIRRKHLDSDIKDTPCYACITELPYVEADVNKNLFSLALHQKKGGNDRCD